MVLAGMSGMEVMVGTTETWRDGYVARIEETTWGRDGRWQGSLTHANSHESWRGTDDGGDHGRQGKTYGEDDGANLRW